MIFWGLVLCNSTSDRLETGWVTPWGSGLSIWIETGLWKQGVSFLDLSKISGRTGRIWVFEGLLLCNATSDRLKTDWVTPWGSGLSIWIETGLWKQGVSFLDLSKITGRIGIIWYFEGFYYAMQHQIVLKLVEGHPGRVDCQSELKLVCGNRAFPF